MNKVNQFPSWITEQLPAGIERHYFNGSFGKIHYLKRGAGQKVILLHGNPTWSFLWRKVIAELKADECQIIAPDLLNLGFSDTLSNKNFTMKNHVEAFTELFKSIDLTNAILVVQDWGGPIGLASALKCNTQLAGLVVLNTGVAAPKSPFRVSKFHTFVHKKIIPDLLFNFFRYPMYSLHKTQHNKSSIAGEVAKAYRYPMKMNKSLWTSALKFARLVPNNDTHPSYSHFKDIELFCKNFSGPVEVVWGIKDPILGRGIKTVEKVFKSAHITEVNAGHFLQEECPLQIASSIKRILEKNK